MTIDLNDPLNLTAFYNSPYWQGYQGRGPLNGVFGLQDSLTAATQSPPLSTLLHGGPGPFLTRATSGFYYSAGLDGNTNLFNTTGSATGGNLNSLFATLNASGGSAQFGFDQNQGISATGIYNSPVGGQYFVGTTSRPNGFQETIGGLVGSSELGDFGLSYYVGAIAPQTNFSHTKPVFGIALNSNNWFFAVYTNSIADSTAFSSAVNSQLPGGGLFDSTIRSTSLTNFLGIHVSAGIRY
jgi:hypothetical protein